MLEKNTFNQLVQLIKKELRYCQNQMTNNQTSNWLDDFILCNSDEEIFLQALRDNNRFPQGN